MSLEDQVREEIRQFTATAIGEIVGAAEREAARKRIEACEEELVAIEVLRRLPRWRWLKRAILRAKARNHGARCAAQRALRDPLTERLCQELDRRRQA